MKQKVTIKIPRKLYNKLSKMIKKTGFTSVTQFIVYTMRTIASGGTFKEDRLTDIEIKKVRQRLKALGYLD